MTTDPPPFDPTSPDWRAQSRARALHRATSGVVPVKGDYPGRVWTLAQIGTGWPIYSSSRTYHGGSSDGYPIGGVVVDVLPAYTDLESGEIVPTRYRALDTRRPEAPWQTIEAPNVDTSQLEGIGRQMSTSAVYWLLHRISRKRQVLQPDDVAYLRDAHALGAAVLL